MKCQANCICWNQIIWHFCVYEVNVWYFKEQKNYKLWSTYFLLSIQAYSCVTTSLTYHQKMSGGILQNYLRNLFKDVYFTALCSMKKEMEHLELITRSLNIKSQALWYFHLRERKGELNKKALLSSLKVKPSFFYIKVKHFK